MSMELTTKEGDVVRLDFSQLYAQYQEFTQERSQEQSSQGVRMFESRQAMEVTSFEEKFAFSVEGDLNQDELQAIFDVFAKVEELATSFYSGNIEEAFQKALDMEIDMEHLQSFSLEVQRSEIHATSFQQAATYQGVEQQTRGVGEVVEGGDVASVSDLPPYLQKIQAIIVGIDEQFEHGRSAFEEIMSGVLAQAHPEEGSHSTWLARVQEFHDQLADSANLNKITLSPSGVEIITSSVVDTANVEAESSLLGVNVEEKSTTA